MKTLLMLIGALLVSATQANAQGTDTAVRRPTPPTVSASTASGSGHANTGSADPAIPAEPPDLGPRCWLGCKGSLNHTMPGEWQNAQLRRQAAEALASHATRRSSADTARIRWQSSESSTSTPARPGVPAPDTSRASPAEAQRYLIEEWRQTELEVADSVHHVVLVRIARTYDSAQQSTVSAEDRQRILRQVDGINQVNQVMWFERRRDVNHQADSAMRAVSVSP